MISIASVGFATLQIIPSLRGLESSLRGQIGTPINRVAGQAGSEAGESFGTRFRDGLSGLVSSAGKVIAGGFALGAAGAAVLGGSLVKVGVSYNALEQQAKAAFTTVLGSGEAATKMMSDLREFAKTSPFPRQAFIEATQQMLGFGVSAQRVIPTLKAIQDAVAASGRGSEAIGQITDAFAQMQSQGKFTGETIAQLGDKGIDAATILGKEFGKTGAEIRDMASKPGGIPVDKVWDPLVRGIESQVGGAADSVKQTWTGAIDRIKGAFRDIGSDIVEPFVSRDKGGAAVEWANTLADSLRSLQKSVVPALSGAMTILAQKIQPFVDRFAKFLKDITADQVNAFVIRLSAGFEKVRGIIAKILPLFAGIASGFGVFAGGGLPFIGPLLRSINPLAAALIALAATSPEVREAFMNLLPIFKDLGQTLISAVKPVLPVIGQALGSLASVIGTLIASGLKALAPVFESIVKAITPLIPIVLGLASSLAGSLIRVIDTLAPIVGEVAVALGGALADAFDTLAPVLPVVATAIAEVAVAVGEDLANALIALAPTIPALADLVSTGAELIAAVPPDVLAKIVEAFLLFQGLQAAREGILGFKDDIFDLIDVVKGGGTAIKGFAENIADFFARGGGKDTIGIRFLQIQDAASGAVGALRTAGSAIATSFAKVGPTLAKTGRSLLDFGLFLADVTVQLGKQGIAWLALNARILATRAASIAAAVAQGIITAATEAWTAAQWLLNAAMTANPIGVVVVGIAALVAAVVLAYTNIGIFREAVDSTISFIVDNWPIALAVLTGGLSLVAAVIIANWDTIRSTVEAGIRFVSDIITSTIGAIVAVWTAEWNLFTGAVSLAWAGITSAVNAGIDAVRSVITGWFGAVTSAWSAFWRSLVDVVDVLREVPGRILSALGDLGNLLLDAGTEVVRGFLKGIEDEWESIPGKLLDLVTDLPGLVKRALGIASPSKVFIPIGEAIPEGLALGIENGSPAVAKALDAMLNEAVAKTGKSALPIKVIQDRFKDFKGFAQLANELVQPFVDAVPQINDALNDVGDTLDLNAFTLKLAQQQGSVNDFFGTIQSTIDKGKPELGQKFAELGLDSGGQLAKAYAQATPEVQDKFEKMLSATDTAMQAAQARLLEVVPAFGEAGVSMATQLTQGYTDSLKLGDISLAEVGRARLAISGDTTLPDAGLFKGNDVTTQFSSALQLAGVSNTAIADAASLVRLNTTLPEGHKILSGKATTQYLQALLLAGATQEQIDAAARTLNNTGGAEANARGAGGRIGNAFGDGITGAIASYGFKIGAAAAKAMDEGVTAARYRLRIFSPSQVTRDLIGKPFGEGIAVGIAATTHAIGNAATSSLGSAIDATRSLQVPAPKDFGKTVVTAVSTLGSKVQDGISRIRDGLTDAFTSTQVTAPSLADLTLPTIPDLHTQIDAEWAVGIAPTIAPLEAEIQARWVIPEAPEASIVTSVQQQAAVAVQPVISPAELTVLSQAQETANLPPIVIQNHFEQPPTDEDVRAVEKATRRGVAAGLRAIG